MAHWDHRRDTKNKLFWLNNKLWLYTYDLVNGKKNKEEFYSVTPAILDDVFLRILERLDFWGVFKALVIRFSKHNVKFYLNAKNAKHDLLDRRQRIKAEEDECLRGFKLLAYLCVNSAGAENQRDI